MLLRIDKKDRLKKFRVTRKKGVLFLCASETSEQLTQNMDDIFGEEGKLNSIMEDHLGDKGTFSEQLEKHFGENGFIVKELFDPLKEGTPLNHLMTILAGELRSIKEALAIQEATEKERQKGTQKGRDFEDVCDDLLSCIVKNHKGDVIQRTTTIKGLITDSKKGDFTIDVAGKEDLRIVIETKDYTSLTLPKINQELNEALKNRGAKYGIFVAKWNEALPSSVGCFNYYNDDRIVCSLGSKDDEVLHDEILHVAYCWARAHILKKSASCEKVNFESIDDSLSQIKSQLDTLINIKSQCKNINTASKKIVDSIEDIDANIREHLRNIHGEMEKGMEKELES